LDLVHAIVASKFTMPSHSCTENPCRATTSLCILSLGEEVMGLCRKNLINKDIQINTFQYKTIKYNTLPKTIQYSHTFVKKSSQSCLLAKKPNFIIAIAEKELGRHHAISLQVVADRLDCYNALRTTCLAAF